MKVAILGYGSQGVSAYEYWKGLGDEVTICDSREDIELPDGAPRVLGPDFLKDLDQFDLLVRAAPIIHPREIVEANSPEILKKVTTNTDEFFRVCPSKNVIGVTGTKGKGTTSTLITKMLEAAGRKVHLGGNIGIPPLELLKDNIEPDDWVVLELASFQLIHINYSPHIGVCLMVVPEHLNWHKDMEEYLDAKSQMFAHQTSDDIAVYYADNEHSKRIAAAGAGHKFPYYKSPGAFVNGNMITINGAPICTTDEIKLLGRHNWQNVCAAVTVAWLAGVRDPEPIRSVATSFTGLPYHLELVRELDGVTYYNDSFGTTPETCIVALEAFTAPKVVIIGGADKGVGFDELAEALANNNVRRIILIGNTENKEQPTASPKIAAALEARGITSVTSLVKPGGPTMTEVLDAARAAAQPGDVVLLSAATASFDMFPDYKERGRQFTEAVQNLTPN